MPKESITAGICLLSLSPPSILMVYDVGEVIIQKDGSKYVKPPAWKLPSGRAKHFDASPASTAVRELFEETGIEIAENKLDKDLMFQRVKRSFRPDSDFHRDIFFMVILEKRVATGTPIDPKIRKSKFVPIDDIPIPGSGIGEAEVPLSHIEAINALIDKASDRLISFGKNPFSFYLPTEARE